MAKISLRHVEGFVKDFVEHGELEGLLRRALEASLCAIMEGEVTEQVGAGYGEQSPNRVTSRNGYRDRRYDTPVGTIDLRVPKLRQGSYQPSFLKAHQRSDDALCLALVECFRQGVSTRNAEAIARSLGIESLSKSTVSRMLERLDPMVEEFRHRTLPECAYVYVDARYERVREDHAVRKVAVLIAIGVRVDGAREVLGFDVARVENRAFWSDFLRDLRKRGLEGVKLMISDAHEGLRRAIEDVFPDSQWQRCKVHFLRNLGSRLPKKRRGAIIALTKTIFEQDDIASAREQRREVARVMRKTGLGDAARFLEETDDVLTYLNFPAEHRTKLHSTNAIERVNRELKRRTRVVSIFPNRASLIRLTGALLLEEHEEWLVGRRYISETSMKKLRSLEEELEAMSPGSSKILTAEKAA